MAADVLRDLSDNDLLMVRFDFAARGSLSAPQRFKIENIFSYLMLNVRLYAKLTNGRFEADEDPLLDPNTQGLEMMTERWVEVRFLGLNMPLDMVSPPESSSPFKAIGGRYGIAEDDTEEGPANFLQLPDIAPGQYGLAEVRMRVPAGASTEHLAGVRFGVSFEEEGA